MRKVKFRYEEWYDDVCTAGDNGQSEIWLEVDGKELTPRRRLATKEIINVTRHHCTSEAFQAFYSEYHIAVGKVTRLDLSDLDVVAMELRLHSRLKAKLVCHTGNVKSFGKMSIDSIRLGAACQPFAARPREGGLASGGLRDQHLLLGRQEEAELRNQTSLPGCQNLPL